jgi:hypothetical protein
MFKFLFKKKKEKAEVINLKPKQNIGRVANCILESIINEPQKWEFKNINSCETLELCNSVINTESKIKFILSEYMGKFKHISISSSDEFYEKFSNIKFTEFETKIILKEFDKLRGPIIDERVKTIKRDIQSNEDEFIHAFKYKNKLNNI